MNPHPYRLRPYHNPEKVDESAVPDGWRMRYQDEMPHRAKGRCRLWLWYEKWAHCGKWTHSEGALGHLKHCTYIVPVNETNNTTQI